MKLSMQRPKIEYNCTQEELYKVCLIGWDSYQENLAGFTAFNTTYTLSFGQAAIAAVHAAELLPDFQQRGQLAESLLIDLVNAATQCIIEWKFLEGHIKKAFPPHQFKPNIEAAGSTYYEKAANENWEYLSVLMRDGATFITDNTAALTAAGMPAAFPTAFTTAQTNFEALYQPFKDAQQDAHEQRDNKINANNAIYHALIAMFEDGKKIFRMYPAKKERFTFTRVLNLVSSGSGNGGNPPPPPPPVLETLTMASKQNPAGNVGISMMGADGENVVFKWNDGTSDNTITVNSTTFVVAMHLYTTVNNYTIQIIGTVAAFMALLAPDCKLSAINIPITINLRRIDLNNNLLVSFYLPASCTNLIDIQLNNNELDQQSVNALLVMIESFGTSNGMISIVGGSNASPSGLGIAAKNLLISRGWTVITN